MPSHTHPDVVVSSLSKRLTDQDHYIDIQIYRLNDQNLWTLEVVDELGASTIWDEWFDTEEAALGKALRAVDAFGIDSFLEDHRSKPTYH